MPLSLEEIKRKYANARRRALYWSGNPSWSRSARSQETTTSTLDLKYDLAMYDCRSWEQALEIATGVKVPKYDPKNAFIVAYFKKK